MFPVSYSIYFWLPGHKGGCEGGRISSFSDFSGKTRKISVLFVWPSKWNVTMLRKLLQHNLRPCFARRPTRITIVPLIWLKVRIVEDRWGSLRINDFHQLTRVDCIAECFFFMFVHAKAKVVAFFARRNMGSSGSTRLWDIDWMSTLEQLLKLCFQVGKRLLQRCGDDLEVLRNTSTALCTQIIIPATWLSWIQEVQMNFGCVFSTRSSALHAKESILKLLKYHLLASRLAVWRSQDILLLQG